MKCLIEGQPVFNIKVCICTGSPINLVTPGLRSGYVFRGGQCIVDKERTLLQDPYAPWHNEWKSCLLVEMTEVKTKVFIEIKESSVRPSQRNHLLQESPGYEYSPLRQLHSDSLMCVNKLGETE